MRPIQRNPVPARAEKPSHGHKPILIAGAGLASLLLARSLQRSGIPFVIFEREKSMTSRAQGYRLILSGKGLDAIESVLGREDFPKFWAKCSQTGGVRGVASVDAFTAEVIDDIPQSVSAADKASLPDREVLASRNGKTIGISRGDMRAIFLEGIEHHVRWDHNVTGYELTQNGVRAIFADGCCSMEGDLLVAGDGIYSKVAKQVSNGKLKTFDTGARGIHGEAPTTAFKKLGEGIWRLVDDSKPKGRVFAMTNVRPGDMDDPNQQFVWTMIGQPGVIRPPNDNYSIVGKAAANMAKNLTTKWHPHLRPMFEQLDESEAAFWRITCSSPSGVPVWRNEPRVTVIGDSAHSMTPAGGIGANTAVRDSALLGRLLREAGGWSKGVTAAFEKEMRVYASHAVATSYGIARVHYGIAIDEATTPTVG